MNKFWGRNGNNKVHKFSRDNDQLLSLNYENLCDSDYLARLFSDETGVDLPGNVQSSQMYENSSGALDNWEVNPDTAEDVLLFGDDEALGRDFLNRRLARDSQKLYKYHDSLAQLVHRQVDVYEHIANLMVERTLPSKLPPPEVVVEDVSSEALNSFVINSLVCTFQLVEKQSRKGWKPSSMEPVVQLLLNSLQGLHGSRETTIEKSDTELPFQSVLATNAAEYLRASFCNAFLQSALSGSSEVLSWREQETSTRVAFSAAYGLLAMGVNSGNAEDIMLAILHLLLLPLQVEDWKAKLPASESSLLANNPIDSNIIQSVAAEHPRKQRAAKMKPGEYGPSKSLSASITVGKQQPNNSKYVSLSTMNSPEDISNRESIHCDKPVVFFASTNAANSTNNNSSHVISWEKKGQPVVSLSTRTPLDKLDKEPKTKLGLVKTKPSVVVVGRTSPQIAAFHGSSDEAITKSTLVAMKSMQSKDQLSGRTKTSPGMNLMAAPSIAEAQNQIKSLFFVPRGLISSLHNSLVSKDRNSTVTALFSDARSPSSALRSAKSKMSTYVWSCGQNSYGELGQGDVNQRRVFTKISYFENMEVVSIGAGNEHSAFVTSDGKLIVAGYNDNGQCGTGTTQQVRQLTALQSLEGEEIASVHIYNGCEHTLALTRDGRLYSFGYNYRGQLGHGSINSESCPRPIKNLMSKRVLTAACSYHHSVVLCTDGSLYSFGRNECGQLGHGDFIDKRSPQLISSAPRDVRGISCGQFHTICTTNSGEAFVCGKNDYGQLGFESTNNVSLFTRVSGIMNDVSGGVVQVSCGYYHTLLLLHNGVVMGFGRNDYGQLGLGHAQPKVFVCQAIFSLNDKSVITIAAGCYHSIAVTANGMLYMFGRNNHGQLGSGDLEEYHIPHPVDNFVGKRILAVAGGFYHTLVLTSESLADSVEVGLQKRVEDKPDRLKSSTLIDLLVRNGSGGAVASSVGSVTAKVSRAGSENNRISPSPSEERISSASANSKPVLPEFCSSDIGVTAQSTIVGPSSVKPLQAEHSSVFSMNIRSKLAVREFWLALVDYLEVIIDQPVMARASDMQREKFVWSNKSQSELKIRLSWLTRVIRCATVVIELSKCRILGRRDSSDYLDDATGVKLVRNSIKLLESVFEKYGDFIVQICALRTTPADSGGDCLWEGFGADTISRSPDEMIQFVHQTSSTLFQSAPSPTFSAKSFSLGDVVSTSDQDHVFQTLNSARNEILSLYLFAGVSFDERNLKIKDQFGELIQLAATTLSNYFEFLCPSLALQCQLLEILYRPVSIGANEANGQRSLSDELPILTDLAVKLRIPLQQDRCLKLFSRLCFKYREMSTVLKLFQGSKLFGLKFFQLILESYSKLSMLGLVGKVQNTSGITSGDIFRAVGTLEHCCSNFLKCAVPIIFESMRYLNDHVEEQDSKHHDQEVALLGFRIVRDIFQTAEVVLEIMSRQGAGDFTANAFSFGTVIPSILPSVLLYCIHFSGFIGCELEMLPLVQSLIKKLHSCVMASSPTNATSSQDGNINSSPPRQHQVLSGMDSGSPLSGIFGNKKFSERKAVRSLISNMVGGLSAVSASVSSPIGVSIFGSSSQGARLEPQESTPEDLFWKRDSLLASWWSRLLKICTILSARLSGNFLTGRKRLAEPATISDNIVQKAIYLTRHPLWTLMSIPSNVDCLANLKLECSPTIDELLGLQYKGAGSILPPAIVSACKALRMRQIKTDQVYRTLFSTPKGNNVTARTSPSAQALKLQSSYECIEAILMDCVLQTTGSATLDLWMTHMDSSRESSFVSVTTKSRLKAIWDAIVGFSKALVRNRSQLVSFNESMSSWPEIVGFVVQACSAIRSLIVQCVSHVDHNQPILLFSQSVSASRAKKSLRRSVLVIICCQRWRAHTVANTSNMGLSVVNLFTSMINIITDDFKEVGIKSMNARWEVVLQKMQAKTDSIAKFCHGLSVYCELLRDSPIPSMKTEIVVELTKSLKERIDCEIADPGYTESLTLNTIPKPFGAVCCDMSTLLEARRIVTLLLIRISSIPRDFLAVYRTNSMAATTSEIVQLTVAIKFLRLICSFAIPSIFCGCIAAPYTIFAREVCGSRWLAFFVDLKALFSLMDEKSNDTASLLLSEDKVSLAASRRVPQKDRNKTLRRASNAIVYLIQELIAKETQDTVNCRSNVISKLLFLHCDLLASLQRVRISLLRNSSDFDTGSGLRFGVGDSESPVGSKSSMKEAAKRRCQDLISKAVEFTRGQEGFIVQGDKLLNNYKGIDFTLASWVFIKKRSSTKPSFITGKVSHNDAWPLLVLRNDGKLALYYGHGNEFDSLISQAIIPQGQWTHIAVVVEAKKIKIFINGNPDNQALTKGNTRAILYPVVVGSCPQGVRTRIEQVKDGFDGLLAQYKYHTRALSPIHIRVVFDQGPPESFDIQERWLYQLLGSLKFLVNRYTAPFGQASLPAEIVSQPLTTRVGEVLHMLFVTDTTGRIRIASLQVLTSLLAARSCSDLVLSSPSGFIATGGHSSSLVPPVSNQVTHLMCTSAHFLSSQGTFMERLSLYFIRLVGFCWAPQLLSISDEMLADGADFITLLQQQSRTSRLMQQHSAENDAEFAIIREFLDYIPGFISNKCAKNDVGIVPAAAGGPVCAEASKEDQLSELLYQTVSTIRILSKCSTWKAVISSVLSSIFTKSIEIINSGAGVNELNGSSNEKTSKFGTNIRLFGRHGAWTLLASTELLGASIALGEEWFSPVVGSMVASYFGNHPAKVLNISRTNNLVSLCSWNNACSRRQLSVVRLVDTTPLAMPYGIEIEPELVLPSLLKLVGSLEGFASIAITDHLSVFKPDHGFQRQSLLRIFRPLEIFVFQKLFSFFARKDSTAYQTRLLENLSISKFIIQSSYSAVRQSSSPDEEATLSPSRVPILWLRSAKCLTSLMGKVAIGDYPSQESERSLADFLSKGLGIALDQFQHTPAEKFMKLGRFSELIYHVPNESSESIGTGDRHGANDDVGKNAGILKDILDKEPVKFPINDWLSSAAEGNAINLFGSSFHDIGHEIPATNTLRLLHIMRHEIISSCRAMLWDTLLSKEVFASVNFPIQYLVWAALCSRWTEGGRNLDVHPVVYPPAVELMTSILFKKNRVDVTTSLILSLKFCAMSLLQLNSSKLTSGNVLEGTNLLTRIYDACRVWLSYHVDTEFEVELCLSLLKTLLPALSFVESSEVELNLMQLCRIALHRIIKHLSVGVTPPAELLALAKSNNSTLLRARAQEQLSRQKGNARYQFSGLVQNLTQVSAGLEMIQRLGCMLVPIGNRPSVSNSSRTATTAMATFSTQVMFTDKPTIVGVRQTSVDADLTSCALSALTLVEYRAAYLGSAAVVSSLTIEDFKASAYVKSMLSVSGCDGVTVEVSIGVNVDGEDCVYEVIYCGSSFRFMQSGLSPGCSYKLRCRASVCTPTGPIILDWSEPVDFTTESGIGFTFDHLKCGPDVLLSDDCLTASYAGDDAWSSLLGSKSFTSGVTSWKIKVTQSSTAYIFVGVATGAAELNTFLGGCAHGWGFIGEQALYHNREKVKMYGEPFGGGDIIGVQLDLNAGTLSFSKNGKSLGVAFDKIFGELYPAVAFYNIGQELEIVVDSFSTSCPQEPIPCSLSRLNVDDISVLSELIFCFNTKTTLPLRILNMVADHCNDWCSSAQIRCRTISGKSVFISQVSPASQPLDFNWTVGERVRTPYGVAEVVGFAFNRVWFNVSGAGIWFFSYNQIAKGREMGFFYRCSYEDRTASIDGAESGVVIPSVPTTATRPFTARPQSASYSAGSGNNAYDAGSLAELLDESKWSEEMDAALLAFLASKGEDNMVSPWLISPFTISDEFRTLQQHLSRIVMNSVELSHRWGIAGPKRKAVIARLGLLRLFNHLVEYYLPALLVDVDAEATNSAVASTDDFQAKLITITSPAVRSAESEVVLLSSHRSLFQLQFAPMPSLLLGSAENQRLTDVCLSWCANQHALPGNVCGARRRVFTDLKLVHFWEILSRTSTKTAKIDDDYDYPDDLPQIKVNRFKSFRAREASELMGIAGEDLLQSSMFFQLWRELRKENPDKLRICYTHPMDDGQSRAFKIRFDGEGVDDYGGPYREIFQQICDELQRPDPTHAATFESPSTLDENLSVYSNGFSGNAGTAANRDGTGASDNIRPVHCFIPLLLPTPNWTCPDCSERYKYIFYPGELSPLREDLYCFLGQLVGIALRSKITLEIMLASFIWKCVVREPVTEADLASFDFTSCERVKQLAVVHGRLISGKESEESMVSLREEAEAYIQDQTWTAVRVDGRVVELVDDGANTSLHISDLGKYLELYVTARITECAPAIDSFRRGLLSVIPESAIAMLSWKELEHLVCGSMTIDIKRLQANTEYDDDVSPEDPHIVMFWEILNEFSELEKSSFLRFVWARPTLPPKGVDFPQKFKIQSAVGDDNNLKPDQYFPKAHTCFFSINLPRYTSKKTMSEKLRYAIANCTEMDADFKLTETDVVGWGINLN